MKIALDTNVLLSAIGTRGLCADLMRVVLRDHDLIVGERVLLELRRNLAKKVRLSPAVIDQYDAFLRAQAVVVADSAAAPVAGLDAGDTQVLGDAVAAMADGFVTGDRALLALGSRAPVRILSPRQFWEQLRRGG